MFNSIPEYLRKKSVESLFQSKTVEKSWVTWKREIHQFLGNNFSENGIIDLGDHLSEIFRTTGKTGRGQGELSGGGTAWESLICWYINLCTVNSRVVALKKMSLVPKPIQDAITVNYGNFSCNTESDITVIVFPDNQDYYDDISTLHITDNTGYLYINLIKDKLNSDLLNHLIERDFHRTEIGIIQCKTNWNDNAQIPMLWDMIYSAGGFQGRNITIGRNNFSIQNAQNFTYSFVTVPSNQKDTYKSDSVSIKRVTNLSGGNYWGLRTEPLVARSVKEIFTNNFISGVRPRSTLRNDLRQALPYFLEGGPLDYFGI